MTELTDQSTGRPRIIITRAEDITSESWQDYATCVINAGGEAIAFDVDDFTSIDELPPHDGILITAGVDVDPSRYGQVQSERVTETNPLRDEVEEALIAYALASDVPIFCICRGAQLLNTSRGGQLLQHLEEREPHRARLAEDGVTVDSGWHTVAVTPGSLLADIAGAETLWVNSRHHQAVLPEYVAPNLLVTGVSPDGVIEGLEVPGAAWALGVQWHPERVEMTENPECQNSSVRIFEAFVAACRDRDGESST